MKYYFLIFFLVFFTYPAFADSLTISTDKEFYYTGDTITITVNRGITVEILDPDYTLVMINQGSGLTAVIDGPLWEKSGEYTAIVRDGTDTEQTTFFVDVEKIELANSDRIAISNQKIANAFGGKLSNVISETQVQITADITNKQNFEQEFAYVITVKEGDTISEPRWITGILAANQELTPSLSWVPKYGGLHTITIQIWNNPLDKLQIAQEEVLQVYVGGDPGPNTVKTQQYSPSKSSQDNTESFQNSPVKVDNDVFFIDDSGNKIEKISLEQTIDITTTISNDTDDDQEFVFIVQIKDSRGVTVSINHIQGTLSKDTTLDASLPWKSQYLGAFTYEVFVWNNLDDPNALGQMSSSTFLVQ